MVDGVAKHFVSLLLQLFVVLHVEMEAAAQHQIDATVPQPGPEATAKLVR
jgi:hypothetical protein